MVGMSTPAKSTAPPPQIEGRGGKEHGQVKAPQDQLGSGGAAARRAFEPFLLPGKRLGAALHLLQAGGPCAVLQGFGQTAQAVQHKARQRPRSGAQPQAVRPAGTGDGHRQCHAHHGVGRQGQRPQQRMIAADKPRQKDAEQQRDERRGDGVGVEYFQQLNVRSDDRNQIAFFPTFQLGGGQAAQGAEHFIPQQRQQFEGDEVVAGLLAVAQHRPQNRQNRRQHEQPGQRQRCGKVQHPQDAETAQHREKGGAQVPRQPHGDGQGHIPGQRAHQPDEPGHHGKTASFHAGTSNLV